MPQLLANPATLCLVSGNDDTWSGQTMDSHSSWSLAWACSTFRYGVGSSVDCNISIESIVSGSSPRTALRLEYWFRGKVFSSRTTSSRAVQSWGLFSTTKIPPEPFVLRQNFLS
ncbi:hypothetical protein L218DRAFT_481037 [Marasmius fiardii PR-910]|nr:hypothetical protein L218DRAFT_481037 [Marasmius fiardii PR-910]